tara:strand:+ start:1192 stop:1776 length:585 start_codon:yes stop_codon:yes gene_type:complete
MKSVVFVIVIYLLLIFIFKNKVRNLRIDDDIADFFVSRINFKDISPNFITTVGLICNVVIFMLLTDKIGNIPNPNKDILLISILIVRCLTDILDGAVARKYKKESKFGGLLDSFSDLTLTFIFLYFIALKLNIPIIYLCIFFVIYVVTLELVYNLSETHEKMKDKDKTNIIVYFMAHNSVINFLMIYVIYKLMI